MKSNLSAIYTDDSADELVDLLLEEAERALLEVEVRPDQPGRRLVVRDGESQGLGELKVAVAELVDAFPGMEYEIEVVADRLQTFGLAASVKELETRPHLLALLRLSLELFFLRFPTARDFEQNCTELHDEDGCGAAELYASYERVTQSLRDRLS